MVSCDSLQGIQAHTLSEAVGWVSHRNTIFFNEIMCLPESILHENPSR